jgi:hypothetical protein
MEREQGATAPGEAAYTELRQGILSDAETRVLYEEEAEKKALWLQLVEGHHAAGLTQAEVARPREAPRSRR